MEAPQIDARHYADNRSVIAAVIGILALVLVGGYRTLALKRSWLDHPNARSSHQRVTPRGAGIVFATLITLAALLYPDQPTNVHIGFLLIFSVALIGWWDDLRGLAQSRRLALYWLSAVGVALTVYPELMSATPGRLVLITLALALLLAWLTNLYNFMDGINGLAAVEALFVLGGALWLGMGSPFNGQFGPLLWVAMLSIAGFLFWNFPTGRVFMGDAGSAYLGALLGLLILWSQRLDGPSFFSWLILLGVFVVDTGYTLTARMLTGQQWYRAHRLHAYQLLCEKQRSHARTVFILSAINLLWLLPWAWLARDGGGIAVAALVAAYTPLLAGCRYVKAGIPARLKV